MSAPDGRFEPAVTLLFELEGELLSTRTDDSTVGEDVDEVRHDVIEQTLIMRDQQKRAIRAPHGVHTGGDNLQRVDIEARIGFIENAEARFEYGHLKNLVAFLLAARETLVDRAVQQRLVDPEDGHPLAHERHELDGVELFMTALGANRVEG